MEQHPQPEVKNEATAAPALPAPPPVAPHSPDAVLACLQRLVQLAEIDYHYRWESKESAKAARRTAAEVKLAVDQFVTGLSGLGVTGLANEVNALTTKYVNQVTAVTRS